MVGFAELLGAVAAGEQHPDGGLIFRGRLPRLAAGQPRHGQVEDDQVDPAPSRWSASTASWPSSASSTR